MWKKDKTWLNVTVIEKGQPEDKLLARIVAVDEDASLVAIVGKEMHSSYTFDVEESEFSILVWKQLWKWRGSA